MKNNIYEIRVLPLVEFETDKDNLSIEEINNMSCYPRMIVKSHEGIYLTEMPLTYKGNKVKRNLCYVYNELTEEEQNKYIDRTSIIETTKGDIVKLNQTKKKMLTKKKI